MIQSSRIQTMIKATKTGYNSEFNCWGATQYLLGHKDKISWINEKKMWSWLDKKTVIINNEKLKAGDILVISRNDGALIHTAVYVGRNKWFHKKGKWEAVRESKEEIINHYAGGLYIYGGLKAQINIHRIVE